MGGSGSTEASITWAILDRPKPTGAKKLRATRNLLAWGARNETVRAPTASAGEHAQALAACVGGGAQAPTARAGTRARIDGP
eukprot:1978984-Pyramimonas_sp.AAC.1